MQSFDGIRNPDIDCRAKGYALEALENLGINMVYQDDKENENRDSNIQAVKKEMTPMKLKTPLKDSKYNSKPYHTITIQVDGIFDDFVRQNIEKVILNVQGVISVTLDRDRGRASIGTRSDIEADVIEAVNNAGSKASVWPPKTVKNDEDDGYLDENEYDEKNYTSNGSTLLRWGTSSLASRLEEKRREEEERRREAKKERLIGKVSAALSSAGNWLLGF